MKICCRCKAGKPLSDFHKRSASPDGHQRLCKGCIKDYRADLNAANPSREREIEARRYAKHREKRNAANRARYAENPEVRKAYNSRFYQATREQGILDRRAWYAANRESALAQKAEYRATHQENIVRLRRRDYAINKAAYLEASARRKAHEGKATPPWADLQAIRAIYKERQRRSEAEGILYHVDHVIPLRGKNVCGLHVHSNLRIVPAKVNMTKGNRFHEEDAVAASPHTR